MRKNFCLIVFFLLSHLCVLSAQVAEWVARYNGPASRDDVATAVAVDSIGNVYVTGYSTGAGTGLDYATIKYDTSGNRIWLARHNGPGNRDDVAAAIAMDSEGNVFVTGYTTGVSSGLDYTTIKYDASSGAPLWEASYNGPGNSDDAATAIALDSTGNVYVTGYSIGIGTGFDYATIKYDASGNQIWVARYNGPGNGLDVAAALAVDAAGNAYVTGKSAGAGTGLDYATIKYDLNGNQIWAARYDGPASGDDAATTITSDSDGNIYVSGSSMDAVVGLDYATIKYDADGNTVWAARYNGDGNDSDVAAAIAVDATGYIYVTGRSVGVDGELDYATIKYDGDGNQVWAARYNGLGQGGDNIATALALDTAGYIYVTGASTGDGTGLDYATIKYDGDGNQVWTVRYDGPASGDDVAAAIALDAAGNVYVTGYSNGDTIGLDYATIKYTQK